MKVNTFILMLAMAVMAQVTKAQTFDWAKRMGSTLNDQAVSVTTDTAGNVYTTGYFRDTVDFDPGSGTFNMIASGGFDIFVSKLDPAGNLIWAKQLGGAFNDEGNAITLDDSGYVYITGYFQSTADFDPDTGTFILTSSGSYDIFICKLNQNGNFVWATKMGGNDVDIGNSISLDPFGNIYTTGTFRSTADFDPGAASYPLTALGYNDIFISKLDASGNFLWAKATGEYSYDGGVQIMSDGVGNVYTTGYFRDTVDFDFGPGVTTLISNGPFDFYIAKYNASGNLQWAKSIGGTNGDQSWSMTMDSIGNVYTTGHFYGTVDFNPGIGIFPLTSSGSRDIFISKLDSSGNFVWAKNVGGSGDDRGFGITSDVNGDLLITGMFVGTSDFNPGTGTFNLSSAGGNDIFILKLDGAGNFVWAQKMGGTGNDAGRSITVDKNGNIFTSGTFQNTSDFDPGSGSFNLTSAGANDAFVHKLSHCPASYSTQTITTCDSLTWIDGVTYSQSTNTPSFTFLGGAVNGCDSIVSLDLTITNSVITTSTLSACDSLTWIDGITYTQSTSTPTYTFPGAAANGCDSVVTLDLTISNTVYTTDVLTSCDSLTWVDGITYTQSTNNPSYTFAGAATNGCDSVVTLDLTISNTVYTTDVLTACDSLTWIDGITYTQSTGNPTFTFAGGASNGCDSVVTLDLTITPTATGTDTRTECSPFTWINGITYTESNNSATYNFPGGAANGCDSLLTLDLTINEVSDITATTSGATITANNSAASYQWLDCNNNYAVIAGEINQSYTPIANGSYAVQLTENNCTDTSECINITTVGIMESTFTSQITVYPNPTFGKLSILFENELNNPGITVRNVKGQVVSYYNYTSVNQINLTLEGSPGVYFVEIVDGENRAVLKVIKE